MVEKLKVKVLLALTCGFALLLLPAATAWAQEDIGDKTKEGVEEGAEGVQKGVETGVEKTEEGAETVGRETKEVFTGEDESDQGESTTDTQRMKPSESEHQEGVTTTPESTTERSTTTTTTRESQSMSETEQTESALPATAGELPLLGLIGMAALACAVALRVVRSS